MFSTGVLWLFRLVHILSGVFWVGSVLFFARFLFPTARALGPAAGPVFDHLTRVLKMPQTLLGAAGVSVLSGLGLYWNDSLGFTGAWLGSPTGMVFGTGGLLAILAVVIGAVVNSPTAKRLGALGAELQARGGPPTPEQAALMQQLQRRLGLALRLVATLLVLATAAMAVARYVS
ncbi:MAG TPA: hypothetical protein VFU23_11665 [Gemmatimonadales bacterium]|nr:hypothetical protein [Gemmatimonadales bacterium]